MVLDCLPNKSILNHILNTIKQHQNIWTMRIIYNFTNNFKSITGTRTLNDINTAEAAFVTARIGLLVAKPVVPVQIDYKPSQDLTRAMHYG